MTSKDIASLRLVSQQIAGTTFKSPKEMVGWMGALQAQDYAMSKWALGFRLPGSTEKGIEKALDKGQLLRTHILRPTWHLVSADDIYWMLELTAPHIKVIARSQHKQLELTEAIFTKSNTLIEKALSGNKHLTREELTEMLGKANIAASTERGMHLMFRAELDGIICSGVSKDNKQTYAFLPERVPKTKSLHREEALGKLARIYFTSHCPASLADFIWWSGLSVKDARAGLEMIKSDFLPETIGQETYWLTNSFSIPKKENSLLHLAPAFDELIISYKDRTAVLSIENQKKAFTANGIFRPVILLNGQGIGIWKRTSKKDKVILEPDFFSPATNAEMKAFEKSGKRIGEFLGKEVEIQYAL